jgi:rhamnulose-1-phosphate aldolase
VISRFSWERGWAEMTAGNVSVKLPHGMKTSALKHAKRRTCAWDLNELKNSCFYISGTGKRMRDLAVSPIENGLFLQINAEGNGYYLVSPDGNSEPTSELATHLEIHRLIAQRGTGETAVLHTHATELIGLTHLYEGSTEEMINATLMNIHPEAKLFLPEGVGLIDNALTDSQSQPAATTESFRNHPLVIWQKHGVWAIGSSIHHAFDLIDLTCKLARIWFQVRKNDKQP